MVLSKGHIEQVGTPYELYNFPRNRFVATFIGSPKMNMIEATNTSGRVAVPDFGALDLPGVATGPVSVGVRPEQFTIGKTGDLSAEGKVMLVEYLGSEIFVYVQMPSGQTLLVQTDGKAKHKIGESMTLSMSATNAHYFDAAGSRLPVFDTAA